MKHRTKITTCTKSWSPNNKSAAKMCFICADGYKIAKESVLILSCSVCGHEYMSTCTGAFCTEVFNAYLVRSLNITDTNKGLFVCSNKCARIIPALPFINGFNVKGDLLDIKNMLEKKEKELIGTLLYASI